MKRLYIHIVIWCFLSSPGFTATAAEPLERATVKTETVHIYSEMSLKSDIVKPLEKGNVVRIEMEMSGSEGAWCRITEEGKPESLGYVLCEYLDRPEQKFELAGPSIVEIPDALPAPELANGDGRRIYTKDFSVLPPAGKQWRMVKKKNFLGKSYISFGRDTGDKYHEVGAYVESILTPSAVSDKKALKKWRFEQRRTGFAGPGFGGYKLSRSEEERRLLELFTIFETPGWQRDDIAFDDSLGLECVRETSTGFTGAVKFGNFHLFPPEYHEEIRHMAKGDFFTYMNFYCLTPSPKTIISIGYKQITPGGEKPLPIEGEVEQMLKSLELSLKTP